jgi:uncharacterized protein
MEINEVYKNKWSWQVLLWPIGILVSILLVLIVWQRGFELKKAYTNDKPQNVLSISAEGKVKATPDTATVTLGVLAQGRDQRTVADDANKKINDITNFVKSLGIPKEDITTSQSSLQPQYDWQTGTQKIIGYQSSQTVTVKVRGVDKSSDTVNKLMAGVVENGANQVYGSQFTIDDPDALKQEARKLAIAKAKEKAQELADEAGIRLGKVVSISESGNGSNPPMPYYGEAYGRGGAVMEDKAVAMPSVEVGTQEVVQSMTVTFEIK